MSIAVPLPPRDFLILLALADGESHGYGLVKEIQRLSEGEVRMDPANLYRALRRLVRDGMVTDVGRRGVESSAVERRYYALSESGRLLAGNESRRLEKLARVARSRRLISGSEGAG